VAFNVPPAKLDKVTLPVKSVPRVIVGSLSITVAAARFPPLISIAVKAVVPSNKL